MTTPSDATQAPVKPACDIESAALAETGTQHAEAIVVPHTHWDREWRYPIWKNRQMLIEFMDELMGLLERHPELETFLLDGQSIAIRDYLEVCPDQRPRLVKLLKAGRISVGPWYTLPDLYPLDGECLIRNLQRGIRYCHELAGRHLQVGYNSFGWGQISQFPQIYRGFGFDFLIAAKRITAERAPHCEFWWESPDGTRLLTSRLGQHGRANGFFNAYLPIRHGVDFDSDRYRFQWGQTGPVYHEADAASADKDYFMIGSTGDFHEDKLREAMQTAWTAMDESVASDYRLITCGSDFTTPQPILPEIIKKANALWPDRRFRLGTLEEYAEGLHERIKGKDISMVKGPLREGPACMVSANALATRIPIKQLNKRAENTLLRLTEPLISCLALLGDSWDDQMLDLAWEHLIQSHAHDSINGVTQDKTVHDNLHRLSQALELAEVCAERAMARLIERIDCSGFKPDDLLLLVVNPLPYEVSEPARLCIDTPREANIWDFTLEDMSGEARCVQHIARSERTCPVNDVEARPWPFHHDRHTVWVDPGPVPAGGYKLLRVVPGRRFLRETEWWPLMRQSRGEDISRHPHQLENEFISVALNPDGSLRLTDKAQGQTFDDVHVIEDAGDVGDYWAYYPPYEDKILTSRGMPMRSWIEDNGPLAATLVVEHEMRVPARADVPERYIQGPCRRIDETTVMRVVSRFTLRRGKRRLDVHTTVHNTAEDHRVRILLPTGIQTDHSDAAVPFYVDRNPIKPHPDAEGRYWPEIQLQPMHCFVDVSNGQRGLAVISDSLTEYQLLEDDRRTLALTLFRAMRNRICSEHRSSGVFPSQKGSQLLEPIEHHYAIVPHSGRWDEAGLYREALTQNMPPRCLQVSPGGKGDLPTEHSFWSVEPAQLVVSAFKQAEGSNNRILRVFNPTRKDLTGHIHLPMSKGQAWSVRLDETREAPIELSEGRLELEVPAGAIRTIELESA